MRDVWRLIEHTTELRALHVERIDRLVGAEPRVQDAIARLRYLDVLGFLKLQGVGDAATLTSNLRSKPRKVILDCRTLSSSYCDGYFVSHVWFLVGEYGGPRVVFSRGAGPAKSRKGTSLALCSSRTHNV